MEARSGSRPRLGCQRQSVDQAVRAAESGSKHSGTVERARPSSTCPEIGDYREYCNGGPYRSSGNAAGLKDLGIRLAIDDFGTGYSSLSYLHRFPLDTLKIDRSFISGESQGLNGMEIARTVMPLAKNLQLDVVAEGVETAEQVQLLKNLECKYAQGFFFSEPLSAEEAAALLAERSLPKKPKLSPTTI